MFISAFNICSAESYVYMFIYFFIAIAVRKIKVLKGLVLYDMCGGLNLTAPPCSSVGSAVHVSSCVSENVTVRCDR